MRGAAALLMYATVAGTFGAAWLMRAEWPQRAPRLGVLAWHALSLNVLLATGLAGLSLAVGLPHASMDLAALIDMCAMNLRDAYATPGGAVASLTGMTIVGLVAARLVWSAGLGLVLDHRERRRKTWTIDLLGRQDLLGGVTVIEHPAAFAFCVPGRHRRIVLTSATLAALNVDQLQAVVAHEQAHLRGRHHIPLSFSRALAKAFPFVPAFRFAEAQVAVLLELLADDNARETVGAVSLRAALASLTQGPVPQAALAASSVDVGNRITRLSTPPRPLRGAGRLFALATIGLALSMPLLVLAAPAIAAATEGLCLFA